MAISQDINDREHGKFEDIAGKPVPTSTTPPLAIQKATDSGDSNITYIGESAVGTATSSDDWRIRKIDYSDGMEITWADGDSQFNNVWDDRESLSYS